jgi:hypothetical protein
LPAIEKSPTSLKRLHALVGLTGGLLRVIAGLFGVSGIGREIVPHDQPYRDVEAGKDRKNNNQGTHLGDVSAAHPQVQPFAAIC